MKPSSLNMEYGITFKSWGFGFVEDITEFETWDYLLGNVEQQVTWSFTLYFFHLEDEDFNTLKQLYR